MDNVIPLFGTPTSADEVLEEAKGWLPDVLVIGYDAEGRLRTLGTELTNAEALYMVKSFERRLMSGGDLDE